MRLGFPAGVVLRGRKFSYFAVVLVLSFGAAQAHAAIVEFDFTGHITVNDAGPLAGVLNPFVNTTQNAVSGFLRFDASTAPTSPGVFNVPSAQFHVQYPGITLDTTGGTAMVSTNQDLLVFGASFPLAEFLPISVTSDTIALGFQTFTNNYFSLLSLPTTVPPNDHNLGFQYMSGGQAYGASTDTNVVVTARVLPATVPEQAGLALLGSGLGMLAMFRRRSS